MADIANAVFGACLTCWDRTANYRRYIKSLGDNLTTLESKIGELGHVYDDVDRLVSTAEEGDRWIRKHDVAGWEKAEEILVKGKDMMGTNCLCGLCLSNCRSRYKQSKLAEAKGVEIETALVEGRNFKVKEDVAYEPADPPMFEIPLEPPVGLDSSFEEVWKWVQDDSVRRIGIYGMGGVGKTTLLKKIHNEFLGIRNDYDVVAWVVVSQPIDPTKIQKAIWDKLNLPKSEWDRTSEFDRAPKILNIMKRKSFLLFLDDVWDEINLLNIGIPYRGHQRQSKIIFTTRSGEVCGLMQAERTKKIGCLPRDKALELFREKKKCFLYCSIFPEDYVFDVDELIDLWMGEGFLSECECSHEARDWGIDIIRYLIRVCLLEVVDEGIGEDFKMHDVVRDMALWLVSEHGQKKNKIVCLEKQRSFEPKEFMKWTNAETIYLQLGYQKMENFAVTLPAFSSLSTLIIRGTSMNTFPKGFFSSMPLLRVLDLSSNSDLEDLPNDIGALVNLTYLDLRWTSIIKLPVELKTLTKLVFLLLDDKCDVPRGLIPSLPSLRVLWMSRPQIDDEGEELNVIEELMNGMNNQIDDVSLHLMVAADVQKLLTDCPHLQRCLRQLDLTECEGLRSLIIPKPSLRRMENLRALRIWECGLEEISVVKGESYCCGGETGRSDGSGSPPHPLPSSYYPELTSTSSCLESHNCFRSLKKIVIGDCDSLKEVTAVIYHAPSLTYLAIEHCDAMRELISGDVEDSRVVRTLSCLIHLQLTNLPELESICKRGLPFPSLKSLLVMECPKLKKLPLDSKSRAGARQLSRIEGGEKWWDGLRKKKGEQADSCGQAGCHYPPLLWLATLIEMVVVVIEANTANVARGPDWEGGGQNWDSYHWNQRTLKSFGAPSIPAVGDQLRPQSLTLSPFPLI
ncbi:hypothetical protein CRG98_048191 [Punica granatum]|uniref:Uncharacterized protein n=1 Tax=Punica granatum TaxID=22663 RepID=A0A2I0HIU1_PUNGR|nr:hypothetical protein CRG98_048191 [Punica granatum]